MAGQRMTTRELRLVWTALGPLVSGGWPLLQALETSRREAVLAVLDDVPAGLYVAVDADERLRWLGKAHRDTGVGARVREHLRHPERARTFAGIYVINADPWCCSDALAAAEGKAADLLQVRGILGPRTWPSAQNWLSRVVS